MEINRKIRKKKKVMNKEREESEFKKKINKNILIRFENGGFCV